eukprot:624874-Rhodomonas_salina.2
MAGSGPQSRHSEISGSQARATSREKTPRPTPDAPGIAGREISFSCQDPTLRWNGASAREGGGAYWDAVVRAVAHVVVLWFHNHIVPHVSPGYAVTGCPGYAMSVPARRSCTGVSVPDTPDAAAFGLFRQRRSP